MKVIEKNGKYFWEEETEVECMMEYKDGSKCTEPPVHRWAHNVKGPWCQDCHDFLIGIMDFETGGWKEED